MELTDVHTPHCRSRPADCPCSALSQIDFLNSVIVDLQRRNEELNSKIRRMCEAALNGNEEEINNYDRYESRRNPGLVFWSCRSSRFCGRHRAGRKDNRGFLLSVCCSNADFLPGRLLPGGAERSSVVSDGKHRCMAACLRSGWAEPGPLRVQ